MIVLFLMVFTTIQELNNVATIKGSGTINRTLITSVGYANLVQIIIKYGPTLFEESSLDGCKSLRLLNISESITRFSSLLLSRIKSTVAINVASENPSLSSDSQGILFDKQKNQIIHVPRKLTSIIIPETVIHLLSYSLFGCRFQKVNIPSSVTNIFVHAFNEATVDEITFEKGTEPFTFNSAAFRWCSVTKIHIPSRCICIENDNFFQSGTSEFIFDDYEESSLTTLGSACFTNFQGKNITLPQKVKKIPDLFLDNSPNLEYIFIPRDCSEISSTAFSRCPRLGSFKVDLGNRFFASYNGSLFNVNFTKMILIPFGVTSIKLPETLEEFGASILQTSSSLTEIKIGNNTHFSFNDGLVYDSENKTAIAICGGILSTKVLDSTTTIGKLCFASSKIQNITFGSESSLCTILENAFTQCNSIREISFPKTLSVLSTESFSFCTNLKSINFDPDCGITVIPDNCFTSSGIDQLVLPKNVSTLKIRCFYHSKISSLVLPENNSLTRISNQAFLECPNLKHIYNQNKLETIEPYSFAKCPLLEFPFENASSLRTIGNNAFENTGLKTVKLCGSIETINDSTFSECKDLQLVEFAENAKISSLSSFLFSECSSLQRVTFSPLISKFDYTVFSGCWNLKEVVCRVSQHFVSYNGAIYEAGMNKLKLCIPGVEFVNISKDATQILENAFRRCLVLRFVSFEDLSKISTVAAYTFYECSYLEVVRLPDAVESLGISSFQGCHCLKELPLDPASSVRELPDSCFKGTGLKELTIPLNVTSIKANCFANCTKLKRVVIGDNVGQIDNLVFDLNPSLNNVLFCGKRITAEKSVFGTTNVDVYVSYLYQSTNFGGANVVRCLDPDCALITKAFQTQQNDAFLLMQALMGNDHDGVPE